MGERGGEGYFTSLWPLFFQIEARLRSVKMQQMY